MRPALAALLALAALFGSGCRGLWANMAGHKVANDQLSAQSFHGRTVEKHMLTHRPDDELVKEVWYQKLSKVRVEVVAPRELAGQLFVYDGAQVSMWWPSTRFGVRMRGVPAPLEREQFELIAGQTASAWNRYEMTQFGAEMIAGRETHRWSAEPRGREGYTFPYDAWVDSRYALPLKVALYEAPGQPWYEMHYEAMEYDIEPPASAFAFEFPEGAMVLDWDLAAQGVSREEAQAQVDFPLLAPLRRHIEKVIVDRHVQPVATLVMNEGARWLTLTESRQALELVPPTGKPVRIGASTGYLDFLGSYSTLSWSQGGTRLTLISNLAYDETIAVAQSVGE